MKPYRARRRKRKRLFRPGYDRTAGLYGRFRKKRRMASRTELKFFDLTPSEPTIAATMEFMSKTGGVSSTTNTLVDLKQGISASERIGRKCTIKKITLRLHISKDEGTSATIGTTAGGMENHVRFILFWDKQCNGAQISATDLLVADTIFSFQSIENSKRFKILWDKTTRMVSTGIGQGDGTTNLSATSLVTKLLTYTVRVNIPIEYSSTTGAITEMRVNNIGLVAWSEGVTGSRVISLTTESRIRIRFVDL